ncbi:radical SAM protein [Desulfuromonas versatilis]|uniref:radical SAM protein n=1 Tax=Desulfuromonas versatilis TaxID=2802975 RepID=UPI001C848B77|nr:radical SAM protein [Desulfuromonas versatilis]
MRLLEPTCKRHPKIKTLLKLTDTWVDSWRNTVATRIPQVIKPEPRSLFVAITAQCNLRCKGCHYGRGFMAGEQLELPVVRELLNDAKARGFEKVRLYGGEPLLHKDLAKMVEHATGLGLNIWVTTNGLLLRERADELFAAGLRKVSIGFYGAGAEYDDYVQRPGSFARLEAGLAWVRERYGSQLPICLDWVLMRPTSRPESLRETLAFVERHDTPLCVNLIHYSLPYFSMGVDRELQFAAEDRGAIEWVVEQLAAMKARRPDLITQPRAVLNSIPDWLVKGPQMRVPCDSHRLVWVGADGTVQMCYVTFKLGNLHEKRLGQMLFGPEHMTAARSAFALQCPNCHCGYDNRTLGFRPTRRLYSGR